MEDSDVGSLIMLLLLKGSHRACLSTSLACKASDWGDRFVGWPAMRRPSHTAGSGPGRLTFVVSEVVLLATPAACSLHQAQGCPMVVWETIVYLNRLHMHGAQAHIQQGFRVKW